MEEGSREEDAVSLPTVWDAHIWETEGLTEQMLQEKGGDDDVSMATGVMETSV